jgi:hypothetical protein
MTIILTALYELKTETKDAVSNTSLGGTQHGEATGLLHSGEWQSVQHLL